jgi:hypothetical protein
MGCGRATTPDLSFDEDRLGGIDSIPVGYGHAAVSSVGAITRELGSWNTFLECVQPQTHSVLVRAEEYRPPLHIRAATGHSGRNHNREEWNA